MKRRLIKIIISFALYIIALAIQFNNIWINNIIYIISYLIVGFDIIKKAIKNIFRGKVFDENFLMTVATVGAFIIKEFPEAVAVMLFYQVGELFQSYAVDKSRKSISELMDIRPDYANVLRNDKEEKVDPDEVKIGEIIIIKPGDKVPLDGTVIEGESRFNTMALTGESIPKTARKDDKVLSGYVNLNGVLKIQVDKEYEESTVNKILDLVENATNKKSKSENFITKFAKYYTPIVVIIAVFLAMIPPIIIPGAIFSEWLYRALSFLVVSCPCALVISVPLSFFGGIGGASKLGILIKGSNYLEKLAKTDIIAFDKTGTLTEGVFEVQKVNACDGFSSDELIRIAAYAENYSSHPIAKSIKSKYNKEIDTTVIGNVQELSGLGIDAIIENKRILIGNEKLFKDKNVEIQKNKEIGTVIYVSIDNKYAGNILIADKIKEDSITLVKKLRENGIKKTIMLTGDKKEVGEDVAKKLNIDIVHTELLPDGKVKIIDKILKEKEEKGNLAFAGDGINDAPVLALADIGIAMGGLGSDAAIEAADIVIMTDEPSKIVNAINISRKTMKIVKENIIFAISIKIIVLILSAIGLTSMWMAVFADVGVSIIAILNSLRIIIGKRS